MPNQRRTESYQTLMDLIRLGGLLHKAGNEFFRDRGLTQAQFNTLMVLRYTRPMGCRQNEICELLLVKPANVTGLVGRLQERGLVSRKVDSSDERARLVSISAKGQKLLKKVEPEYYAQIEDLMSVLSGTEARELGSTVTKIQDSAVARGMVHLFAQQKDAEGIA